MPAKKDTVPAKDPHAGHNMQDMKPDTAHRGHKMGFMSSAYSLNLPMSRNGSGTSWLPDNSPMYMYMTGNDRRNFMFHGNVFLRYTSTDFTAKGSRGAGKFDAPNWFMGMMNHRVGKKGCSILP